MPSIFKFTLFWTPPLVPSQTDKRVINTFPLVYTWVENQGDESGWVRVELYKDNIFWESLGHVGLGVGSWGIFIKRIDDAVGTWTVKAVREADGVVTDERTFTISQGNWIEAPPRMRLIALIFDEEAYEGQEAKLTWSVYHTLGTTLFFDINMFDLTLNTTDFEQIFYARSGSARIETFVDTMGKEDMHFIFSLIDYSPDGIRIDQRDVLIKHIAVHNLKLNSVPLGIPFSFDGRLIGVSNINRVVEEGTHEISIPREVIIYE